MKTIFAIILALLCFLLCCKKAPPPQYTIKGRVLNGTTGQVYANQQITATAHTYHIPETYGQLGTCITDAQGNFSLTYTQTSIDYDRATIDLQSQFFALQGLAVNQNIDSSFYLSTLGKVNVYLQTNNPLETNKDTFFLAYIDNNGSTIWDTVTHTINGLYKEIRVHTPKVNLVYGRDYKEIHASPQSLTNIVGGNVIYKNVTGDPYIDSVTIDY